MTGIRSDHLRDFVIVPALTFMTEVTGLRFNSESAIVLMQGTIAHESHNGQYLRQHPSGPARGICQMEQATYDDVYRYLLRRTDIRKAVQLLSAHDTPIFDEVVYNLAYAVALARVRYWYVPEPLPAPDDIFGMARYWSKHYNTRQEPEKEQAFIDDYRRLVQPLAV